AVLLASRGHFQAATAVGVGQVVGEGTDALADLADPEVLPGALTLSSRDGQHQLIVTLYRQVDLTAGSTGTRYFVSDDRVASVSADGLVIARAPGDATITVVHGRREARVALHVEEPRTGRVTVGPAGAV